MRAMLLALAATLGVLAACSKSDADREKERIQDRAAEELKNLKQHLGELEKAAEGLTKRLDDVDDQLTKLADELVKATDAKARAEIENKLERLKIDREDIERKLDELREQLTK